VIWCNFIDVSEESAASIITVELYSSALKIVVAGSSLFSPRSTTVDGVTPKERAMFIITARNSHFIEANLVENV
jgi:hypothetical protein